MTAVDAYDQRYYREWSHELPPMRIPGHALEVDLHHTIAPVTSRTRAKDELLFAGLRPLEGSRFLLLDPADQIIHAAIHLFQDSELNGGLRDLVDIDGLLARHMQVPEHWSRLCDRAREHGATRVLWYALHYCERWLGTPVPRSSLGDAPPALARRTLDWVFVRSGLPRINDRPAGLALRLARQCGQIRYHWLRMPPMLLACRTGASPQLKLSDPATAAGFWPYGRSGNGSRARKG